MAKLLDRAASTVGQEVGKLHVMVAVLNIEPRKRMQQPGRVRGSMGCEGKAPTEQNLLLPKIAD